MTVSGPLQWRIFDDHPSALGESPVWDDQRGGLWWIDGRFGKLFWRDIWGGPQHVSNFGERIGSIGLTESGRVLIAFSRRVEIWDPRSQGRILLSEPFLGPRETFNDGKVGPDGAFWVGSKGSSDDGSPAGRLYRVASNGRATPVVDGLATSNGLAWTADARTLFLSDSKGQWIDTFAFDRVSGSLYDRRRLAVADSDFGRPDGAATDMEDCYWSCGVSAGRINRISRDGTDVAIFVAPVAAPTMVCFGGQNLKTLYLTSLRRDGAGADCGKVFSAASPVAGVPVMRFRDE